MTAREQSLRLPAELMSVREGRRFARDVVVEWGLRRLADEVQLGVSELITNAVRHAKTDVELRLQLDDRLYVEVRDFEPTLHRPVDGAPVDPLATSGRGLQIVAAVSRDWGVRGLADGKAVWFTLDQPDLASPDAEVFSIVRRGAGEDAEEDGSDASQDPPDRSMQARAVN
jgi:anti-sigma regulatory factor (Ser/Thr protein kinase)